MKKYKKYKYRKVTPEILEKMKKLREGGLTYKLIAEKVNIDASSVQYWLSPQQRENAIKRGKKSYAKLTKEEIVKRNKKQYKKAQKYYKERYHEDEEFRKDFISMVRRSFKKRKKAWIEKGLCSLCGRKREDKKLRTCKRCRKIRKEGSRTKKYKNEKI